MSNKTEPFRGSKPLAHVVLEDRLLDAGDGQAGVQALGARLGAVHDRVAPEQLHPVEGTQNQYLDSIRFDSFS